MFRLTDEINMTNVNKDAPPLTSPRCQRQACERVCCRERPQNDVSQLSYDMYDDNELPPGGFPPDDSANGDHSRSQGGGPPGDRIAPSDAERPGSEEGPQSDLPADPDEPGTHGIAGAPAPEGAEGPQGPQGEAGPRGRAGVPGEKTQGEMAEDTEEDSDASTTTMLMRTIKHKNTDSEWLFYI